MADKFQNITELYESTAKAATATPSSWRAFLTSACRNYRLPFDEQLLIYAQRPDATAVLELDRWNQRFGRWVNRGAKGIAVFDRECPHRLRYYFDVADTHETRMSRPVPLWQVRPEYEQDVVETLENSFGELENREDLGDALLSAARNAAEDNLGDYLGELGQLTQDSLLEGLDRENLEMQFRVLLGNGVAAMLLARCGIDTASYLEDEDFQDVGNFNTPETRNALGVATRDIARMCLDEIARTVLSLERQGQKENRILADSPTNLYAETREPETPPERRQQNGSDLHHAGELLAAQSAAAPGEANASGQVRPDAEALFAGAPENHLHQPVDQREAEQPSGGDSADRPAPDGGNRSADGESRGCDGGTEGQRPDEVGADDEQPAERGGRNGAGGTDLQLTQGPQQLSLFPSEQEQIGRIDQAKSARTPSAFSFAEGPADEEYNAVKERSPGDMVLYQKGDFFELFGEDARAASRLLGLTLTTRGVPGAGRVEMCGFPTHALEQHVDLLRQRYDVTISAVTDAGRQEYRMLSFQHEAGRAIPQESIDHVLRLGGNTDRNRERVAVLYEEQKPLAEIAASLPSLYHGGDGIGSVTAWYDQDGIHLSQGKSTRRDSEAQVIPWQTAAERIGQLLENGRFATNVELAEAGSYERTRLADRFWNLYHDLSEEAMEAGYLQSLSSIQGNGFPEESAWLTQQLADPAFRAALLDEYQQFLTAHQENWGLLRFHYHRLEEMLRNLRDLDLPRKTFSTGMAEVPEVRQFITEDEIDAALAAGPYMAGGKGRIYAFFQGNHTSQEKAGFLKQEYGIGGRSHALSGNGKSWENSDGQGLVYRKENCLDVRLSWTQVARHIDHLVEQGRYLSPQELDEWEKNQAEKELAQADEIASANTEEHAPSKVYDLGYGHLGNGVTVWNRLEEEHGDYKTVAHIAPDRTVQIYDEEMPQAVREEIQRIADTSEMTVSATQDAPVFTVLPRAQEPPQKEELSASPTQADLQPKKEGALPLPPKRPRRERITFTPLHPEILNSERHNFRITDDHLGAGGAKTKFRNNVAAIQTLRKIESEGRLATPEEQEILSRYVGWGGLPQVFDGENPQWAEEFAELKGLLSPEEYDAAKATTLNAHYTSPTVIKAIYQAVENMGFRTGNILEPSCGIGNFFGLVPESMKDSHLYGVELDPLTGRIAQQLYQQNSIAVQGFENTELPDSFFDLAIGNVPFGSYSLHDKRYDKHHFLIHDYFFAKTLDKVRPGGIVAFITSKGTMDKQNPSVRKYLAERAQLIGAIRLPNNAFLANAGTQVTTDILFLQKREKLVDVSMPAPDSGLEWLHLGQTEDGVPINQYFLEHPEMMLGQMAFDRSMYGNAKETTCKPLEGESLSDLLAKAVGNLRAQYAPYEIEEREDEDTSIPADPTVKNFSYTIVDGQVYYRENSLMHPVEVSVTAENRIRGMIELRDCARSLLEIQMENGSEDAVQAGQQELNRLYDSFTAQYGLLNSRANTTVFSADSSFPLLCSLEILDEQGNLKRKADLFTKRTIQPYRAVTHVDTASEALAVSLGEKARVDLEYMGSLTGKTQEQLAEELRGVIFPVPGEVETNGKPHYATADEYLSGNVREKLRTAKQAAEQDGTYSINVEALEKVQPKDLTAGEISVRLGATWIPEDVAEQFTHELLQTPFYYKSRIRVRYSPVTGEWNVSEKSLDRSSIRVFNTYGTKRVNAYKIVEDTLNLRDVRVFDTVQDENGKEQRVLNKKETAIAQDKQDQIKEKFQEWVWSDPARRERLCSLYNEKFNAIRPREYDGSHLVFAGMNPEITLRPHQRNAVARTIYGGNALFAHVVGAGKTYEMIAAAMESKRLGLSSKALFVVPNHIIGDFASDFLDLYPGANILVATKKDFEKQRRKKFCARIATGDYDGIILGHSQFEKIPLSSERQQAMLKKQIAEVVAGIQVAKKQEGARFTVKQMEKSKKSLEAKLKKLNDQSAKDDVVTFEELGVDRLFIDEADLFKNLYLYTKMRNVGGISQTESLKASDLYMKCQYMDELTGGKGVVFATGTPVSNSMAELYTMQRYLQGKLLKELGLSHFDAWASQFGETVTSMELKPEGQGFQQKTRFSNFYNLPELMALFKEVADIQTADMLNLPVPKAKYETVVCKPSGIQKEMVEALGQRADAVRSGAVDASQDNMLLITNDGRKLALDQRLLNPLLPDMEGSKVNVCAEKVYQIWKDTQKDHLTQLVFCDLSTPKSDGTFSVYNDLKDKLMARGIPEEEIAFVHSAANETQKQQLFGKVRAGQVRVLLGSTAKMGAGTNVQDRLIALHDLDCPWRPRDLEQRSGRIIRQGNQNLEVRIYRYVTEGTFDSYLYQMVENKQRFISQVFTSKAPARVMQEIDDVVLSYNEIKALATGNPQIIERANLETEVNKLKMLRASFLSQKYELEDKVLKYYPKEIQQYEERIAGTTADIARRDQNTAAEGFAPMNVKGIAYTEKAQAGKSLLDACSQMESTEPVSIGSYRGFGMELSYEAFSKEYQVSLKGALSHRVSLGTDVFGNITRLDNALNGLEQRLESNREALERTKEQMAVAKTEAEKPFPREQELRKKSQRLAELTKLLKLDEKDRELLDSAPDEGEEAPARKVVGRER